MLIPPLFLAFHCRFILQLCYSIVTTRVGVNPSTGDAIFVTITYMSKYEAFAGWLVDEMDKRGLNQSSLARKAKISSQAVSSWLNLSRTPGPEVCLALAKALQLPPVEIFIRAGLLPADKERNANLDELVHILAALPEETQLTVLEIVKSLAAMSERDQKPPK
ncbi:MAG: helix-turn-helix domain-containing protein [Anaerolineaceae bacterium]